MISARRNISITNIYLYYYYIFILHLCNLLFGNCLADVSSDCDFGIYPGFEKYTLKYIKSDTVQAIGITYKPNGLHLFRNLGNL